VTPGQRTAIAQYLRTGEHDLLCLPWPGDVVTRSRHGAADLKDALVAEVNRRASRRPPPAPIAEVDLTDLTRRKVEPMVRGLFPRGEREAVLGLLARSVVVLTPATVGDVVRQARWLGTAWRLANLYLRSIGARPLGPGAPDLVGISEETTCWVSSEYFRPNGRFEDFVVHEAAHVFHNCKRRTAGLPETRCREWLLDIAFGKRETFAYACEAYARIVELGETRAARLALVEELAAGSRPSDERVDGDEYVDVLREAATARNGWRCILARCAPPRRR